MNLAEQLQKEINFNSIISKLQRELSQGKEKVFIPSHLANGNIERLKTEGFDVNSDGMQYNGGVYVGFKVKNQWSDRY